ncbi:hypothetical protein T439DRAFT_320935 [Meredithblackwellia eburnea MCA 4105]
MEKFSKWRDPATGIAPFLIPLPASTTTIPLPLTLIGLPFVCVFAGLRTLLAVILLLVHWLLVEVLFKICLVAPPLFSALTRAASAVFVRAVLFLLGFSWITVEDVSLKRTSRSQATIAFAPGPGDIIIGNSSSEIELLYLAFRFNATFLLPVSSKGSKASADSPAKITSWRRSSLLTALRRCGSLPERSEKGESFEDAVRKARGPLVVFPECTTSNNRALLKPASVQESRIPGKPLKVFLLSFRYELPTLLCSTSTLSIPSPFDPFVHFFKLSLTPIPRKLVIRRLHSAESPKLTTALRHAEWEGAVETLAVAGRWKRTGLDWEAKQAFLEYREKRK